MTEILGRPIDVVVAGLVAIVCMLLAAEDRKQLAPAMTPVGDIAISRTVDMPVPSVCKQDAELYRLKKWSSRQPLKSPVEGRSK